MPSFEWVEPSVLWKERSLDDLSVRPPQLVKLTSDKFLPEFLEAMAMDASRQNIDHNPEKYLGDRVLNPDDTESHIVPDGKEIELQPDYYKLFQPLHSRYYLVTASLVCRQFGLPDKAVDLKKGEKTTFIVRRLKKTIMTDPITREDKVVYVEDGWIDGDGEGTGWQPTPNGRVLLEGEERFPLHPVTVPMKVDRNAPATSCCRKVYYGYIAAGKREKYLDKVKKVGDVDLYQPGKTAAEILQAYYQKIATLDGVNASPVDFRLNEFDTRVVATWAQLLNPESKPAEKELHTGSLYLILDLADYLNRALNDVWKAIISQPQGSLSAVKNSLLQELNAIHFKDGGHYRSLADALRQHQSDLDLLKGKGVEPQVSYDLRNDVQVWPGVVFNGTNYVVSAYSAAAVTLPLKTVVKLTTSTAAEIGLPELAGVNLTLDMAVPLPVGTVLPTTQWDGSSFKISSDTELNLPVGVTLNAELPSNIHVRLNSVQRFSLPNGVTLAFVGGTTKTVDKSYLVLPANDPHFADTLTAKVNAALGETSGGFNFDDAIESAENRLELLRSLVKNEASETSAASYKYIIRMVYDYDPHCPPVVSGASERLIFARQFDPDAPPRILRMELPSIKPQDLRKYRHGVGMQMSPELRRVMNGLSPSLLTGGSLTPDPGGALNVICTFSIPIITLIAFILMMIFAIVLNIIFWWLAFLKICFPIPSSE